MDNVYRHIEYPVMLWKPAAPVYPKLIQEAPEGLTKAEADALWKKGKSLLPICKLAKNGVYASLVKDVREAFEGSPLVTIDCNGMHASDYKKIGAKLKLIVTMHSINVVLLLGDTILNGMRFPLFRIAYFILWTGTFVVFLWIIHSSFPLIRH